MDLNTEYLKAIIEYGSISKAANELYISQPYLSQFIKHLENKVGTELINRQTSPITLTYAGDRYLHYMDSIHEIQRQMRIEMQDITHLKKGKIKIGVSPFLATYTLYKVLPAFMDEYPGVEIELVEEATKILEKLLIESQIDVCLNSLPIDNPNIRYEYLFEEYNDIVVPPRHHLQTRSQIDPIDLDGEPFILAKPGLGLRRFTDAFFKKHEIRPKIILETINAENALQLANSGIGITIVPQSVIENAALALNANVHPILDPDFKSHIVISYKKDAIVPPAASAFVKMTKDMCTDI